VQAVLQSELIIVRLQWEINEYAVKQQERLLKLKQQQLKQQLIRTQQDVLEQILDVYLTIKQ